MKKNLSLFLIFLLCLFSTAVTAQTLPVGEEFTGEWLFERAETQARPVNSQQPYANKKSVSRQNLFADPNFQEVPVRIMFQGGYATTITTATGEKDVFTVLTDYGTLEFRIPGTAGGLDDTPDFGSYPILSPSYSVVNFTGNQMYLQFAYYGSNDTENMLTIYYKR